jgi:hypothetical protein
MENESTRQTPWSAVGILLLAASITVGCNTDSTKESAPILETLEDVANVKTYRDGSVSIDFSRRNTDLAELTNLLPELVKIENLRGLRFFGDIIDNHGVTLMSPLPDLNSLSFSRNTLITDECLNNLKGYKYLQHLGLDQTNIGDDGLGFLSHLEELQTIDLHQTKVTDDGLEHLKKLSKLKVLKLTQTTVTTWGHDNLKAFLPKCDIRYSSSWSNQPPTERTDLDLLQIRNEVNSSGTISDEQAESLSKLKELTLPILKSITDTQGESLSKVERLLLGLTVITDEQAESLSRVKELVLPNLKSITDAQAESLSNVQTLKISDSCQELVDKYKKP